MDSKKNMIDEMKAFNKALETHLPNLDLEYVKDVHASTAQNKNDDEYFALLANNLMELRTEMALTRKNLSTEVESMVLRTVNEQQNKFFEQIKKFYGVIMIEVKENISNHLKNVNDELNNLKRKYTEIAVQNDNMANLIDDTVIDIKDMASKTEDNNNSVRDMNTFTKARFEEFFDQLEHVSSEINKRKFYFEDNLIKLNKRLSRIEAMTEELCIEYGIEKKRNVETYSDEDKEHLDKVFVQGRENAEKAKEKTSNLKASRDRTMDKIKEIEDKLEKLNDLR